MTTRADIIALLSDWHTWHAPYGAAMAVEDQHLRSAGYTTGGLIQQGAEFDHTDAAKLKHSYQELDAALSVLADRGSGPLFAAAHSVLREVYLADPADPTVVERVWRKKPNDARAVMHDLACSQLAHMLKGRGIHVVKTKGMSKAEAEASDAREARIYGEYRKQRNGRKSDGWAIQAAANALGVTPTTVSKIVEARSNGNTPADARCIVEGCGGEPHARGFCSPHYQRMMRAEKKLREKQGS